MKISITAVKRLLPVDTIFQSEMIGRNRTVAKPEMVTTTRKIVKQGNEMISEIIEGDHAGKEVYLAWKGLTADLENNVITISKGGEGFLKITFPES